MLSPARPLTAASSDPLAQIRDVLRRDPLFPIRALHSWVMANQRQHLTLAEATAAAQGRVRAGDCDAGLLHRCCASRQDVRRDDGGYACKASLSCQIGRE